MISIILDLSLKLAWHDLNRFQDNPSRCDWTVGHSTPSSGRQQLLSINTFVPTALLFRRTTFSSRQLSLDQLTTWANRPPKPKWSASDLVF